MQPASNGERDESPAKFWKSSPPVSRRTSRDDAECADERDCVNGRVEKRSGESSTAPRDEAKQCVTSMRDSGVGEQTTHIGLRERDEIANQDRQCGQGCEHGRPAGYHGVPVCAALHRREANQHDFSKHHERGDLRARSDKCRARHGRPLVSIGRPQVEWRSGDFEGKTDESHHDANSEERLDGPGA